MLHNCSYTQKLMPTTFEIDVQYDVYVCIWWCMVLRLLWVVQWLFDGMFYGRISSRISTIRHKTCLSKVKADHPWDSS